ncbi:MAG TPA: PAS domain S-box protein [Thermoanaerobaculia bacterium]
MSSSRPLGPGDRHARLLDALPAIAWSADAHTFRFKYINPAAEKILGYPASRWIDEPHFWSQHLHPEDRHIVRLCHNETLACRNHELVYRMIAADGRTVWIRDYINVYSVEGAPIELFGVMIDITREREAEAAWKESRENFRRMVALSPDCIGVHAGGEFVYVNKAFVELLGARNERQIVGRAVRSIVDPAYHPVVEERLARLSAGESVPYVRMKYRRMDGSLVDVEVAALPLRYDNRDAVQVIARDITDRVRAEEELQVREARLQLLASGTHEAIWEWVPSRNELWTNHVCKELIGPATDPDEFFETWLWRIHPEDRHKAWEVIEDLSHEDLPIWWLEYRLQQDDGSYRIILDRGHTAKARDGEQRVIGAMLDVTSLRNAERQRAAIEASAQQALEASERRYRELVEGVSEILYTLDAEGRILSLSRSFERSTGYRVEEWIGRPFAELFRTPSSPRAAGDGEGGPIREYELPARSGAVVTLEVSSQPRYIDGLPAGTMGMARDVTESRSIARKLEEAKRMSSLGQVAASLAHEFNNVLMGIQPFVEVIGRNPSGPRVPESLSHITRAIGRGKRAAQEILRFANPQAPQLSTIHVRTWLPTFLDDLAASLPASIALDSAIETGVALVRGDCQHLEQVVTNLVFNARDAIGVKGAIQVNVSCAEGGMVRISVYDDGPGISAGMLDRIFEPLFTTKRNGTGLGLAIARRLMERQGGALTAENLPAGGSAFHAYVPAVLEDAPEEEPAAAAVNPPVRHILLVEDDLSAGAGLTELLRSEGYETTWVRLAGDAREAARRVRPQVAIIDVNLPDGSGVDLVPLLRADQRDLPVVLSTGHVEIGHSDQPDGIVSLMKPYALEVLLEAISKATAVA